MSGAADHDGPVRLPMQFGKPRDVDFTLKAWADSALMREAEASVALDRESPGHTVCTRDDVTCCDEPMLGPTDANGAPA